jgi:hypothetical protein
MPSPDMMPYDLVEEGANGYAVYLTIWNARGEEDAWWWDDSTLLGSDGNLSIKDFATMILLAELGTWWDKIQYEPWREAQTRQIREWLDTHYGILPGSQGSLIVTDGQLLSWLFTYSGGKTRTTKEAFNKAPTLRTPAIIAKAREALETIIDPTSKGHPDWAYGCRYPYGDSPCYVGSHAPGGAQFDPIKISVYVNDLGCPKVTNGFEGACNVDTNMSFITSANIQNDWDSRIQQTQTALPPTSYP